MNKPLLGCHVKMTKTNHYLVGSVYEAIGYKANTFMIFTGPPQNANKADLQALNIKQMHDLIKQNNINAKDLVVHAGYIINIANSVDAKKWNFAVEMLKKEIQYCEAIGINLLVLHPGSYTTGDYKNSLDQIIKALDLVSEFQTNVKVVLETMSGKGGEVCSKFEDFDYIFSKLKHPEKVGICLDTCHMHDAGYDISKWEQVKTELKKYLSLDKVLCIHLNDSKNELSSHKDRHANIGYGYIGFDALCEVVWDKDFENVPKILETPYIEDNPPYKAEIENLVNKTFSDNL
ncbi:deoxyribonuclease IV [Mycoplasma putrefaciens]|uniref:Probable endonuclease 4 n=1 Tax=Mycoplasma putrefaciens Mput9231 TaxID=1292033 RepID=M9WD33_9MOLU|nr:deoxyribonuclease IV [Mycoplasma putrefaciens]AGJ90736.1 Endonuclease IV [Mycoplasma putrefaciens Mput9231]